MRNKSVLAMLKDAGGDFTEDRALRLSAAMAYYAAFSIGPLLFLVAGVAGLVFGEEAVRREVQAQLKSLMGAQSTGLLESMAAARQTGGNVLSTVVGVIGLLVGATGVFGQLQDALNTIWEVKARPGGGITAFLRTRFLSFGMVLVIGFLLLLSMALTTFVHAASSQVSSLIEMPAWVAQTVNMIASFAVITVLFAAILKFLPDVQIGWKDVWAGAIGTALLYTLGKFILSWYLGRESTTSAYGAGGAFIVVLLYIYYSSIILFFGAEFTQVYARSRGTRIVPSKHAVFVRDEERARQGLGEGKRSQGEISQPGLPYPAAPAYAHSAMAGARWAGSPLQEIREHPYSFLGLALTAGVVAGLFFKLKTVRYGLKWYLAARKFI